MPFQQSTSENNNDTVKKIPVTYPLDKLESNVAQTWSSLEVLSQDFAQMWDQIEKLESVMSLQRQIISTGNEPYSTDIAQNNFVSKNTKPAGENQTQFLRNIPLVSHTDTHNSWSDFFNMPVTNENHERNIKSHISATDEYSSIDRNNLNKGDVPTIRFQTYCDKSENKYEKNINLNGVTGVGFNYSCSESNNLADDQTFAYRAKIENEHRHHYLSESSNLPKSQSWLGLDDAFKNDLHYNQASLRTYYSPQPKRKSTAQFSNVGCSCPILDSCSNTNVSPASSTSYLSRGTEYSVFSKSDYFSPVENRYSTNPFLSNNDDNSVTHTSVEHYINTDNFIVRPTSLCTTVNEQRTYDNVINALIHFKIEPSPPESPPPPAPQDNSNYYYSRTSDPMYDYYADDFTYEYVEPVLSATPNEHFETDDSDAEDIISEIDYLYENEFQRGNLPSQDQFRQQRHKSTYYTSPVTDETSDLIDRLQQNCQLRNMLASAKYKSWTNLPYTPQERLNTASANTRSSLLELVPDKCDNRYQSVEQEKYHQSRLSQGYNDVYVTSYECIGSKDNLPVTINHSYQYQSPRDLTGRVSSVYSLAGSNNYTSVYSSGVSQYECKIKPSRSHTPDLIDNRQYYSKQEMAKHFPTYSYKPDEPVANTNDIRPKPSQFKRHELSPAIRTIDQKLEKPATDSNFSVSHRQFREKSPSNSNHWLESKSKFQESKKGRRGTLRSAFSTVGNSVSHWIPNFNLAQRRHSFPAPNQIKDDLSSVSMLKKKKNSIITIMSGIFHKSNKSSCNSSESELDVHWNNTSTFEENEDVFVDTQYSNKYPDLTKSIPPKRPSLIKETKPRKKEEITQNISVEEKMNLEYESAETPVLAGPVSHELINKQYSTNPIISIDSFEESEICEIEEEKPTITPATSKTPETNNVTPKRFILPKQFSLDVSQGFQNDDGKDDNKSNYSWCSTLSKTSSRRQSTEESIDTEDEWYMYEFRKLENLEKQADTDTEIICDKDEKQTVEQEKMNDAIFDELSVFGKESKTPELEVKTEENTMVLNVIENVENVSSGETSGPDSPGQAIDENFKDDEPAKSIHSSLEEKYDENEEKEEMIDMVSKSDLREIEENEEADRKCIKELLPRKEEDDHKVPGTPSLPRFKYDKSESTESPHASKEEICKDGLGSKWKLLKALKERKAEEKSKETEQSPPAVVSSLNYKHIPSNVHKQNDKL
ncbi:hypothetical protein PGB90_009369 [Kerria lacca]